MSRINIFQNIPIFHQDLVASPLLNVATIHIHRVYIPGSLSFNTIAMLMSVSGTTAKTLSVSFGLYSLNGNTLSLANSASFSSNPEANALSWITFVTSATQDITPGDWFLAVQSSTAGNNNVSLICNIGIEMSNVVYGGPFFRGWGSITGMVASIATSDLTKEGTGTGPATTVHH